MKSKPIGLKFLEEPIIEIILPIGLGMVLALAVRLPYLFQSEYPLNDGGLFYQFVLDIQVANYRLPSFTSYNAIDQIPFAYPPLAFYLTAVINDLFTLDLLNLVRWMPLFFNILAIVPAYSLLSRLLPSQRARIFAWSAYVMLYPGYFSFIMGGGLTRSLGTLFGLTALCFFYDGLFSGKAQQFLSAGFLLGLAGLTHIEIGFLTALIVILMVIFIGFRNNKYFGIGVTGTTAFVVAMPFYLTIIIRHGFKVVLSAFESGTISNFGWVVTLLRPSLTEEPFIQIIAVLSLFGLLATIIRRQYFLAAWLAILFIFGQRSFTRSAILPITILGAIGLENVVIPGLKIVSESFGGSIHGRIFKIQLDSLIPLLIFSQVLVSQLVYPLMGGYIKSIDSYAEDGMLWLRDNTPLQSVVMVPPEDHGWAFDPVNEWLPALSSRYSYLTVQGYEWKQGYFKARIENYENLRDCMNSIERSVCFKTWILANEDSFDYLLIPKPGPSVFTINSDQFVWLQKRYTLLYENEGFSIFHVH